MVIRHVLQYSVSDEGGILTNFIWAVQMPGFMLVAGYFAARTIDSWNTAGKRILLSAQHYALPFFSWFILVNCLLRGGYGRNPVTAVMTLLTHVDSGLWFLWVVFVLSIVVTLANLTLTTGNGRILKTAAVLILYFGLLTCVGLVFGISFLGIKYILYYAVFYSFGWLLKWTEDWWKQLWPKVCNIAVAIALITFLAIVFNYDLYHAPDSLIGIALRCIAGFTGNLVLLWCCSKYEVKLARLKFGSIGRYTLEIYASHICVAGKWTTEEGFFSLPGFGAFSISLISTMIFTGIIIAIIKSNPIMDFILYGKKHME